MSFAQSLPRLKVDEPRRSQRRYLSRWRQPLVAEWVSSPRIWTSGLSPDQGCEGTRSRWQPARRGTSADPELQYEPRYASLSMSGSVSSRVRMLRLVMTRPLSARRHICELGFLGAKRAALHTSPATFPSALGSGMLRRAAFFWFAQSGPYAAVTGMEPDR
jgi:hypothetical protein